MPGLVQLERTYGPRGLKVLAFPCNQFGNQQPSNPEAIFRFFKDYNASFEIFEITNVNGEDTHILYQFLKSKTVKANSTSTQLWAIKWNFGKFLVSHDGEKVKYFGPTVTPDALKKEIEQMLPPAPMDGSR